ncbi:MAG: cytochrome P450, partial [Myxococcales bacterium]|nr:cytochrome P450 [Myxococcales bacterium]
MSTFPGPRSSLAMLWAYVRDPLTCMVPLAETWGDTFTIPGNPPIVLTGHPEGIRAIYTARPESMTPAGTDLGVFIGDTSLILVGGERHKRLRRLLMPPFHGARMRAYGDLVQALVREHTRDWTVGRTVSVHETAHRLSLAVILQAVFGVRDRARMDHLAGLLTDVVNGITPAIAMFPSLRREFGGIGPFATFRRRQTALHAALDALIAEARGAPLGDDILSLLVHAVVEDGRPLTDEELRDQLLLLVVAGHETTA